MNCLKDTDTVPVKVRKVFLYKNENIRIHVGKLKILAHNSHTFMCFSKDSKEIVKAKDITDNDYLYLPVSLMRESGDAVMTDNGLLRTKAVS